MNIAHLKENITKLPVEDRADLARWIISNLEDIEDDDSSIDMIWRAEIRKRAHEIKTGSAETIPAEEMWKDLLSRYEKTA